MALWHRIRALRERVGLSQVELGRLCGVSATAVSLWETEDAERLTRPTPEKLQLIASITGEPLSALLAEYLSHEDATVNEPPGMYSAMPEQRSAAEVEERQLLALWGALPPPVRAALLALMRALLYRMDEETES